MSKRNKVNFYPRELNKKCSVRLSHSVVSDSFVTPWTVACQASLSITDSRSLLKLMSIKPVCHPTISSSAVPFSSCLQSFPASGSFQMSQWPKYWSFSFSISPPSEYSELISFRIYLFDPFAVQGLSGVFSNTTVQKHQFFGAQLSLWSNSHIHT